MDNFEAEKLIAGGSGHKVIE